MIREYIGCFCVILLPIFCFFVNIFFVIFYIFLGWIYIPYILWFVLFDRITPEEGGRNNIQWIRQWKILKWFRSYVYATITYVTSLDYKKNTYVFGVHPHGVISMASWANILPNTDIRIATLKSNFYVPIFRDLLLSLGFISANKKSIIHCLNQKKSVAIVVGGAEESLLINQGIILNKRKGFIEVALKTGSHLVPVYNFGERKLYTTYDTSSWLQRKLKYLTGCTIPLFCGNFWIFPRREPIFTVVGKPIEIPEKIPEPTKEQIDELHKKYKEALSNLHEEYRHVGKEEPLKIVY